MRVTIVMWRMHVSCSMTHRSALIRADNSKTSSKAELLRLEETVRSRGTLLN